MITDFQVFSHDFLFQLNGNPMTPKEEKIQMLTERINDLVQQVGANFMFELACAHGNLVNISLESYSVYQ